MPFNTDHLDKKMDSLSLMETHASHTLGESKRIQESKLNSALGTGSNTTHISGQYIQPPKRSLLSSSLAGEKQYRMKDSGFGKQIGENRFGYEEDPRAYFSLEDTGVDKKGYTDEHPEPELLASSVGKEIGGRLIPSSSTISLLSLNTHMNQEPCISPKNNIQLTSPKISTGFIPIVSSNQSHINQPPSYVDRKSSFTNIRGRNSLTHLNQKRLQTYVASPSPNIQPDHSFISHSTSQSIPINPLSSVVPDSPNLDPTSLGGSPSRFWLTSQTPPISVATSLNKSRTHLYQLQQQMQPTQPIYVPPQGNYTTTIKRDGDTSPVLIPVQTPSEDAVMTPLYLSSNNNQTESYFDLQTSKSTEFQIQEEEQPDESEESLMIDA